MKVPFLVTLGPNWSHKVHLTGQPRIMCQSSGHITGKQVTQQVIQLKGLQGVSFVSKGDTTSHEKRRPAGCSSGHLLGGQFDDITIIYYDVTANWVVLD